MSNEEIFLSPGCRINGAYKGSVIGSKSILEHHRKKERSGDSVEVCKHRPVRVNIALNWFVRCPKMISHHVRPKMVNICVLVEPH
jgi:hypothetical protein